MNTNKIRRIASIVATTVAASGVAMFTAAPAHAEPAWGELQAVTDIGAKPYLPQVAVNENGRAVATWIQEDGDGTIRVRAAFRNPGSEWSNPKFLSTDGKSVLISDVAINDAGRAVVVWIREANGDKKLQLRALSTTGKWSKVRNVSAVGSDASHPSVDLTPAGSAMVAWANTNINADKVLLGRVSKDGTKKVWTLSGRKGGQMDLDTNRTGETVVVWTETQDGNSPIRSRRLMNGQLTTKANLVADADGAISVSMNDGGDALAAYLRTDEGDKRVAVNAGVSGGGWGLSTFVSGAGFDAFTPDTAIAFDGTQVVVWQNELEQIQATSRQLGEVWPASSLIGSDTNVYAPKAVMNDQGDLAIAWADSDPSLNLLIKPAGETGYLAPVYEGSALIPTSYAAGIDGEGRVLEVHGAQLGGSGRLLSRVFDVTA
jgi:hypothetical protein